MGTQFFGALNDNLLKGILSFAVASGGIWASQLGEGGQAYVGLCLTIPFILLSGFAGQLADRTGKDRVTRLVKGAEIGIAGVGLAGFMMNNLWVAMAAMLLLAIQSSFFGPAKYGMIPELVPDSDLSQANGSINMFTNIAVILGTLLAGPIYSLFHPEADPLHPEAAIPDPVRWAPGGAFLLVALLGFAACLFLPRLEAMKPDLKINWNPLGLYVNAVRKMAQSPLITVALAWAFFYMVGMMAILILPDYRDLLDVTPTKASLLLGVLGVAIGIGSVTAGLISGKHIEPRLIPIGAVGMTLFFILLGTLPLHFGTVAGLLFGAGIFAGFYIVPLQSLLQFLSPDDERGLFLGTANAMSFVASTVGSLIFLAAKSQFHISSNRVFLIAGGLSVIGTGYLLFRMRRLITDPSIRRPDRY